MPRRPGQARAGPIRFRIINRTLTRRFVIETDQSDVAAALGYLACDPNIEGIPAEDVSIAVEPDRGWYRIVQAGTETAEELTAEAVRDRLHARLARVLLEERPEFAILHAASLRRDGRRILLAGPKGAGKSTLTTQLVLAGYDFETDESVLLTAAGVLARPRAFRVKETSLPLAGEARALITTSPAMRDYRGQLIFNVDPRILGRDWTIMEGPVDAVVMLRPNHGGYCSIRPLPPLALAQELLAELGLPRTGRGRAIAQLTALANRARGFDMSLGNLSTAENCIAAILSRHGST